jgi:cytidylate kinase
MDEAQNAIARMRAITISREYGSGGGEIAARLAQRLGWRLIDHEVVAQIAHQLNITEEEAEAHDEQVEGFISRLLSGMRLSAPELLVTDPPALSAEELARSYSEALHHVVQAAADTGHAVIVGRGGQAILAGHRDVLHVRVVAPLEQRIIYVARREGLALDEARTRTQTKDRARIQYVQSQHHCRADDPHLYDLVINTGVLDLDSAVDLACLALARKASRLDIPEAELGPGAGLALYPARPQDFPPPGHAPRPS